TPGGALTQTVTVDVSAESLVEDNETFEVNQIGRASCRERVEMWAVTADGKGKSTIQNDDRADITNSERKQAEGTGGGTTAFTFTVSISNPIAHDVTVVVNISATTPPTSWPRDSSSDVCSSALTPGGALTQTVTVDVSAESLVEDNETFEVN